MKYIEVQLCSVLPYERSFVHCLHFISTWSYENRISKHFVIFLNFPCLIASLLCCSLMSYFFGLSCGQGLMCRSGCRQNYYLIPVQSADCTLEKQLSTQGNWIQVQFQQALMALCHRPVFADKEVIICALCFLQFVVYSMRNLVVYRTGKKVVFC